MPDPLSPAQRSLRAQLAAHTSWSNTSNRAQRTAPARAAFDRRFYDLVDPEGVLPRDERERRAQHARKAYFARLALRSARARRSKSGRGGSAA